MKWGSICLMLMYFWLLPYGNDILNLCGLKLSYMLHVSCNTVCGRCQYYPLILYCLIYSHVWLVWLFLRALQISVCLCFLVVITHQYMIDTSLNIIYIPNTDDCGLAFKVNLLEGIISNYIDQRSLTHGSI